MEPRADEEEEEDADAGAVIVVEDARPEGPDPLATSASVSSLEVDATLPAGADVAWLLDSAAGARVQQLGGLGDFSAVSLRGAGLRQTQVMLDGVPLNPDGAEVINLSELPLSAFSRVDVYRGSAPPAFAAAPIGGVVNLVSADGAPPALSATLGQRRTGRLSATGSLSGELAGRPASAWGVVEGFSTAGDFTAFSDRGTAYNRLDDGFGPRVNNDKRQLAVHGRARYGSPRAQLTLLNSLLLRQEGLPGHVAQPTEQVRLDTARDLAVAQLDLGLGPTMWTARGWWTQRGEVYDDRAGELGVGNSWQRQQTRSLGVLVDGRWAPHPALVPEATLSLRRDHYLQTDLYTERADDPRARWSGTAALSLAARAFDDRLALTPVLQGQWIDSRDQISVSSTSTGSSKDDPATLAASPGATLLAATPRLGLLLRPRPALSLKGNVGRYLRPPDFTELFGDRGAVVGNPDLLPERGVQWDLGLRGEWRGPAPGALDAAYFQLWSTDSIVLVQNSQRSAVPINFGRTFTQGVELALTLSLGPWVDSRTSLTWTDSRNLVERPESYGKQLPRVPTWQAFQSSSLHWEEHVRLGHSWTYIDGNYLDAVNVQRAAPRSIHGAFLRLAPTLPSGAAPLTLELSALNLFDRLAEVVPQNPINPTVDDLLVQPVTDFVGYPVAGRTLLLTLRWRGAS